MNDHFMKLFFVVHFFFFFFVLNNIMNLVYLNAMYDVYETEACDTRPIRIINAL